MAVVVLTVIVTYVVASLFGYVMHRFLHSSKSGFLNVAHMTHHRLLYPPDDYLSDTYRKAGRDSTPKYFALGAVPMVLLPIVLGLCGVLNWTVVVTAMLTLGLMGFLHDYLHDAFHVRNHRLTRVPLLNMFFNRWVMLHFQHHVNMDSNYGIFTYWLDRLFGTFATPPPPPPPPHATTYPTLT